jgi:AcrR family transcriptional regulator
MAAMPVTRTVASARQRVHQAVRADIVAEARRQLAQAGAASLSLRAVARDLGMAPSAMYRYFASRDELLTALIVDAYDAMGVVAEQAANSGAAAAQRFTSVCRAIRGWALEHPHEYALLYGTPVPGYRAPELTVDPASRVTGVLVGIVRDAQQAGDLDPAKIPALSEAMAAQAQPVAQAVMPGMPLPVVARSLVVWGFLFGQISFELFGRMEGIISNADVLFDFAVATMLDMLGFSAKAQRSAWAGEPATRPDPE